MNLNEIVQKAKERLAEIEGIEAEAARLRAIIAAAEGKPVEAPTPPVFIPTMPPMPWQPQVPWPHDGFTHASIVAPVCTAFG